MVENKRKFTKKEYGFLLALVGFFIVYAIRNFQQEISEFNTTNFAMSYKYGFISRGLLGTLYQGLDEIMPFEMMNYTAAFWFTFISTLILFICFFCFFVTCLRRVDLKYISNLRYLFVLLSIFSACMFVSDEMFGRYDTWLYLISLIMTCLLVMRKGEWLVVPLSIVCMLLHQGFVFTNANVILVVLFALILMDKGKDRKKYIWIFALTLISISVLFIYFEFFSHFNGKEQIAEDVISVAKSLSYDGKSYNTSIVNHEILGQDVFKEEWKYHVNNYKEFPILLVLACPFIIIFVSYFKRIFGRIKADRGEFAWNQDRNFWIALAFLLGGMTIVPEMILKVDYGRYTYMTLYYYLVTAISLIVLDWSVAGDALDYIKNKIKSILPIPQVILVYAFLLTPMFDVVINGACHKVSVWLFSWI